MFIAKTDKRRFCPCAKTMNLIQVKAVSSWSLPSGSLMLPARIVVGRVRTIAVLLTWTSLDVLVTSW
jgi:hypothetical protein